VYDVAQVNTTQPPDWMPTAEQKARAGRNQAYPSAGRAVVLPGSPGGAGEPVRRP
jgi:hypothetical protein